MTLHNGADSATPGWALPLGTTILAAYVAAYDLPDPGDARHAWSPDEWNLYLNPGPADDPNPLYGGPELRVLPIFVHNYGGDPVVGANNACDAAVDMGWSDKMGRILCLDLETLTDPAYTQAFSAQTTARGFKLMKYGSPSTIQGNGPVPGGTWMAQLTNFRPSVLPPGTVGDQWAWGNIWDLSVFSDFVYANCGQGLRKIEA